jgi:biopolymer transport protein ExbD
MKIKRKRLSPVKETQMVSLADIAFLIIFFFLLSSSFMSDRAAVALPTLPKTGKTNSAIIVRMDADGGMFCNGEAMSDATVLESKLRDLLTGHVTPEECEVRFKCDKTAKYKVYKPVYEAIANAGGVIAIQHDLPQ